MKNCGRVGCTKDFRFRVNVLLFWEPTHFVRKRTGLYVCKQCRKELTHEMVITPEMWVAIEKEISDSIKKEPPKKELTRLEFLRI